MSHTALALLASARPEPDPPIRRITDLPHRASARPDRRRPADTADVRKTSHRTEPAPPIHRITDLPHRASARHRASRCARCRQTLLGRPLIRSSGRIWRTPSECVVVSVTNLAEEQRGHTPAAGFVSATERAAAWARLATGGGPSQERVFADVRSDFVAPQENSRARDLRRPSRTESSVQDQGELVAASRENAPPPIPPDLGCDSLPRPAEIDAPRTPRRPTRRAGRVETRPPQSKIQRTSPAEIDFPGRPPRSARRVGQVGFSGVRGRFGEFLGATAGVRPLE